MKQRKPNTESTIGKRLRLVIGGLMTLLGIAVITVVSASHGYADSMTWLIGMGLFAGGLLLANSMKLIEVITGFVRG